MCNVREHTTAALPRSCEGSQFFANARLDASYQNSATRQLKAGRGITSAQAPTSRSTYLLMCCMQGRQSEWTHT